VILRFLFAFYFIIPCNIFQYLLKFFSLQYIDRYDIPISLLLSCLFAHHVPHLSCNVQNLANSILWVGRKLITVYFFACPKCLSHSDRMLIQFTFFSAIGINLLINSLLANSYPPGRVSSSLAFISEAVMKRSFSRLALSWAWLCWPTKAADR
jgi:hypothetical protein